VHSGDLVHGNDDGRLDHLCELDVTIDLEEIFRVLDIKEIVDETLDKNETLLHPLVHGSVPLLRAGVEEREVEQMVKNLGNFDKVENRLRSKLALSDTEGIR